MMKTFLLIFTVGLFSLSAFANEQVIRCSLRANYEIYRGEGLVERGEGSLIAVPVEFSFFTNKSEFAANFGGVYASIKARAQASSDSATVELSGGKFRAGAAFFPGKGYEQYIEKDQLASFNYTVGANRVIFMRALLKCLPAISWDYRPVNPL
jgi:hypothetical protein